MAYYSISFTLNGERHFTTGESTYPTKSDYENGDLSERMIFDNINMFISGYMDVKNLEGSINPNTIEYDITFKRL